MKIQRVAKAAVAIDVLLSRQRGADVTSTFGMRWAWSVAAWFLAIAPALTAAAGEEPVPAPLESDLAEETGISLTLFEVEVRDKRGRPMPGLTRDDFSVIINGRTRPIYSLDDLCPAPGEGPASRHPLRPDRQPARCVLLRRA